MENIMTLFKSSDAFQQLEKNKKAFGLVNFKTGEILKQPFADIIFSSGVYEIGNREGRINLKTGETIE